MHASSHCLPGEGRSWCLQLLFTLDTKQPALRVDLRQPKFPHVSGATPHRTAPHRTGSHCIAPHRTAPHRTAPHRTTGATLTQPAAVQSWGRSSSLLWAALEDINMQRGGGYRVIHGYEVLELLGKGAFGAVYKARRWVGWVWQPGRRSRWVVCGGQGAGADGWGVAARK